ncbi:type IV secretory system conjugative DNA transfer family protein [Streptomyces sp. NPDC046805]|uniref:type IV secretory system conjugative DNA transfer family protein n=1 Tax=Streptomyces sp. NPDC046805 TaxID=3155134 RepID=UPI0033E7048B
MGPAPEARDRRREDPGERGGQGGVPDGLLVGLLGFLLGMTLLVWTATGLAGWFDRGAWPAGVTFARTPLAMRHLIGEPHDIAGAWPDTSSGQLSGYGLFWGLFVGQLMVLVVLTVFVMGTVARWRAGRVRRKLAHQPRHEQYEPHEQDTQHGQDTQHEPRELYEAYAQHEAYEVPVPRKELQPETGLGAGPGPAVESEPEPERADVVREATAPAPSLAHPWEKILVAPREGRQATAARAVRDAEGPVLVVTSSPALWAETKDARAKLGPTLLYDPAHRCDTPARIHWSPIAGCEDRRTAMARAIALLTPVRPTARLDQAVSDTAETLLRSYLHAAAIDGRTIRHVHRWAQGTQVQEAVRILRTHPKAAPGAAGELEAALTSHPERRDISQELTGRALSALFTVNIREACTPNRTDALALDSFVTEGGTLYVVGESIEDPRANPGAMPLLTALVSSVVERGRRMAERSSGGRLDPPFTLVLDDIAAVAPLPQLPDLLSSGAARGLPTLALLRSREQARSRWPHHELPA